MKQKYYWKKLKRTKYKYLGKKDIKVKKGDKIKICIEGEITAIEDNEYSSNFRMKAEEGEVLDNDEDDNENGTYLGGEEKE